ncbi:putative nasA, partial [Vibrio parahaemolyticus V-223/04]
PVFHYRAT